MVNKIKFKEQNGISYGYLHEKLRIRLLQTIPLKCTKCGSTKYVELANLNNHNYSTNISDYTFLCKRCHINLDNRLNNLKQGADVIYRKSLLYNPTMTEKECLICHIVKPLNEFGRVSSYCRNCDNQNHKDKLRKSGKSRILKLRDDIIRGVRTCKTCKIEKPINEFVKNGNKTRTECKMCYRICSGLRYHNQIGVRY